MICSKTWLLSTFLLTNITEDQKYTDYCQSIEFRKRIQCITSSQINFSHNENPLSKKKCSLISICGTKNQGNEIANILIILVTITGKKNKFSEHIL